MERRKINATYPMPLVLLATEGPAPGIHAAHDAELGTIAVDWKAATVSLEFSTTAGTKCCIVFHGFTRIELPRLQPWGPSVHINGIECTSLGDYAVEFQSGDSLRVVAERWSFTVGTAAEA
jgi:hypothetical protein